ncbi:MAG: hypothetical protein JWM26_4653 [Betaproteobacteria bacterium]|nr:hypothetical protein [Betaproteobacteria bacterium]
MRSLLVAVVAALLVVNNPASAEETSRRKPHSTKKDKEKSKADTGPSCKAPALGTCASCAITCRPGETVTCASGQLSGDLCARQPMCLCK